MPRWSAKPFGGQKAAASAAPSMRREETTWTIIKTYHRENLPDVILIQGSVLDFSSERGCIVNAANEGCLGGGGVDGAITSAGGAVLARHRLQLPILNSNKRKTSPEHVINDDDDVASDTSKAAAQAKQKSTVSTIDNARKEATMAHGRLPNGNAATAPSSDGILLTSTVAMKESKPLDASNDEMNVEPTKPESERGPMPRLNDVDAPNESEVNIELRNDESEGVEVVLSSIQNDDKQPENDRDEMNVDLHGAAPGVPPAVTDEMAADNSIDTGMNEQAAMGVALEKSSDEMNVEGTESSRVDGPPCATDQNGTCHSKGVDNAVQPAGGEAPDVEMEEVEEESKHHPNEPMVDVDKAHNGQREVQDEGSKEVATSDEALDCETKDGTAKGEPMVRDVDAGVAYGARTSEHEAQVRGETSDNQPMNGEVADTEMKEVEAESKHPFNKPMGDSETPDDGNHESQDHSIGKLQARDLPEKDEATNDEPMARDVKAGTTTDVARDVGTKENEAQVQDETVESDEAKGCHANNSEVKEASLEEKKKPTPVHKPREKPAAKNGSVVDKKVGKQSTIAFPVAKRSTRQNARGSFSVDYTEPSPIRCRTGSAVMTGPGDYGSLGVKYVVHAVGPNFWEFSPDHKAEGYRYLTGAYQGSLDLANDTDGIDEIAFCLLSAGLFRANISLFQIIGRGLIAIDKWRPNDARTPSLRRIYVTAFTERECTLLLEAGDQVLGVQST